MSDTVVIDIENNKDNSNNSSNDSNKDDSSNDGNIKDMLDWLLKENHNRKVYRIMNIDISDTVIFNIVVLLQLTIFMIVTMNDMVNNIKNEQLVFEETEIEIAIHSNTFLLLAVVILAVSSTVLIDSIIESIGSAITIKSLLALIYKALIYIAVLSPFLGTYSLHFFSWYSYIESLDEFYYMYFFLAQQNVLATFLAIEIGTISMTIIITYFIITITVFIGHIHNNRLLNYYSISTMLLFFNIGTGLVVWYTKNEENLSLMTLMH